MTKGLSSSTQGVSIEDGVIRITQAGTYILRGSYEGQICIEAGEEDTVRLVLDGFAVSCSDTSPIYGLQCKKLILTLAEGTENQVSDGSSYVFENPDDDEPDAAIFCKGDLTVNGSGSLTVNGNYSNGIRSKEDLKIISGQIQVTAVKDRRIAAGRGSRGVQCEHIDGDRAGAGRQNRHR